MVYTDHAIGVELSKFHKLAQCGTSDIIAILVSVLPLDESKPLPLQICSYYEIFLPLLQDKLDEQNAFLITLACRCRAVESFREMFGKALFGLFQKDCLDESAILEWYEKANRKKKRTDEEIDLLEKTQSFISWLQEAESEEEEEDDDDDDDDE